MALGEADPLGALHWARGPVGSRPTARRILAARSGVGNQSRYFDLDVVAFRSNLVTRHTGGCRGPEDLARGQIEAGAVPGAGDDRALHLAFREGSSPMRTGAVNGVVG